MIEVIYYVAASLDGFIATPDGGVDWLSPFEGTGEDYGYAAFYASIDALLIGSRTYEQALGFGEWPYAGKPCWVFSRRRIAAAQPGVTVTAADPRDVLRELEDRRLRRTWLVGGGALAASFRERGLIATYIVTVVPVLLGEGIPLFATPGPQEPLTLLEATPYPSGLVQLTYRRGGHAG